jgi:hypothetical protein
MCTSPTHSLFGLKGHKFRFSGQLKIYGEKAWNCLKKRQLYKDEIPYIGFGIDLSYDRLYRNARIFVNSSQKFYIL